jgi:hypothetical protein
MCRPRVGEANPLFSLCRALWRPTALAKRKKVVGRQRNLGLELRVKGHSCLVIWQLTALFFLYVMYKTKCFPTNLLSFKIELLIWSLSVFYFMPFSFCETTWTHISTLNSSAFPITQCSLNSTAESMLIILLHDSP